MPKEDIARMQSSLHSHISDSIIPDVERFVLDQYKRYDEPRLTFHNYQQTVEVVNIIHELAEVSDFGITDVEVAIIAGWFHNVGYLHDYDAQNGRAIAIASDFLNTLNYPRAKLNRVIKCLYACQPDVQPASPAEELLSDAYTAFLVTTNFEQNEPLYRLELELKKGERYSHLEWNQFLLDKLMNARFYTGHAKLYFEPMIAQNILHVKERIAKQEKQKKGDDAKITRPYQNIERKIPVRANQTLFRTAYRNQINLSAIADGKANMMISVNSIIVSLIITILSIGGFAFNAGKEMYMLPIIVFLVTGLTSLIFSVLSARPKVTSMKDKIKDANDLKHNALFFGNFAHLSMEEFEKAMDALLRDGELAYGNMSRDLYNIGKVLDQKFKYLQISYDIFMMGFVLTVVTFLVIAGVDNFL